MKKLKGNINTAQVIFFTWMFLMTAFIYLRYHPVTPVTLNEFYVVEDAVKKGENVTLIMDFEKNIDVAPRVSFSLVDGISVPLLSAEISRPQGANNVSSLKTIPDLPVVVPGIYRVQVDLTYRINAFRPDETVTWISEPFEVTE